MASKASKTPNKKKLFADAKWKKYFSNLKISLKNQQNRKKSQSIATISLKKICKKTQFVITDFAMNYLQDCADFSQH